MIANFNAYKRHADVIEATALIVGRRPRFKLVLFGDGPEQASIERLVSQRHLERNVVLAGARLDAAELLPGFDLSVLASSKEGFPNALMESMARGVPVVATRVGGVPELVRDAQDGRLVDVARPDQLAAAILELLDAPELRRRMGAAGSARVRELFSAETMVARTESLYLQLLSSAAR
jgi:glycosyltransferase involved in cell wall biosynthesis